MFTYKNVDEQICRLNKRLTYVAGSLLFAMLGLSGAHAKTLVHLMRLLLQPQSGQPLFKMLVFQFLLSEPNKSTGLIQLTQPNFFKVFLALNSEVMQAPPMQTSF